MRFILACVLSLILLPPAASQAELLPQMGFDDGLDAGAARAAMLRGEILSLDKILAVLRQNFPGEIIEIELELEDGVFVYEFDILAPDGRLFEVEIAAATGKIVEIEEGDDDE
jgi:uncharacterized membrane protein YkoI